MDPWTCGGNESTPAENSVWTTNGIALGYGFNEQIDPVIVADGSGGSMLAWTDDRSMIATDVYAQRIDDVFGYWGHPEPVIASVADVPADQGGKVKINWTASDQDRSNIRTITHYSVWRAVDPAAVARASVVDATRRRVGDEFHGTATYPRGDSDDRLLLGVDRQSGRDLRQGATASPPQRAPIRSREICRVHQFRVVAHTADAFVLFKSLPAFGHSVDNLAPAAPLLLIAQRVGRRRESASGTACTFPTSRLFGVSEDVVRRHAGADQLPRECRTTRVLIDTTAPTSALYYIVTAYDVHANQSAPSNEASVQAIDGMWATRRRSRR